jgi:hypothetical protein
MFTEYFSAPKSIRNRVMGTMMMSSSLWPNMVPLGEGADHRVGALVRLDVFPRGFSEGKSFETMSCPMMATGAPGRRRP